MTEGFKRRLFAGVALAHVAGLLALRWFVLGEPATGEAFVWVAVLGATAAVVTEASSQRSDDPVSQRPLETLTGLGLLALVILATLRAESPHGLVVAGAALLIVAGLALRMAAVRTLGAAFKTTCDPAQPLVRRGLYSYVRHPSEWGLAALGGGFAVLSGEVAALLTWAVLLLIAAARIRIEESEMTRAHGSAYSRP